VVLAASMNRVQAFFESRGFIFFESFRAQKIVSPSG
jgi:hypothetical protein